MELKDRVALLRKELKLTQSEFGKKIGVARNTVASYETGFRIPKKQTLISMSREFNVDIDWLITGEGDMFLPMSDDALDDFAIEFGLDNIVKETIREFLKLPAEEQIQLCKILVHWFGNKTDGTAK